jgi:hypothetical protein
MRHRTTTESEAGGIAIARLVNHITETSATSTVRLLVVVEGINDIDFLRRVSRILHRNDAALPDLADMESTGTVIFIPFGGSHIDVWSERLAPLQIPEFHLYDHELPPETEQRYLAAERVNQRAGCRAVVTGKRSLENYLHPAAIAEVAGIDLQVDDFSNVAETAARELHQLGLDDRPWATISRRARSRMSQRAKRWLNTRAVERMTVEYLREQDSAGEVTSWFLLINDLLNGCGNLSHHHSN